MIKKILEIDGSQYEEGEVVKEYWVFDDDDSPAARLIVEDMNLVLRDEYEDSIYESVEQADDTMEPLLALWRDKRIDIMAQDLPYTSSTFYEEETFELGELIRESIDAAERYIKNLRERRKTDGIEQMDRYLGRWRKLDDSLKTPPTKD